LAAAFLGIGFGLGYRDLVARFCDVELPKSETRSDSLRRPLSASQMQYAANDVQFLLPLRERLAGGLEGTATNECFREDLGRLLATARSVEDPQCWLFSHEHIPEHAELGERRLGLLQQLCHWREREARARDLPRNWLIGDAELVLLARRLPKGEMIDSADICSVNGIHRKFAGRYAKPLAEFLNEQLSTAPPPPSRRRTRLDPSQRETLKQCRRLARLEAERIGICPELLTTRKPLQQLVASCSATGEPEWPRELQGWRQQVLAPVLAQALPGSCSGRRTG